jgi:CheY-like chemotaxis protein
MAGFGGNMPSTLLLADDSVTIQKVVGISFANEDVVLVTVSNGTDAIAKAREVRPDIVLADVVMPGKNGYEVCEALKSDPALRHVPVLLLTGTFEAFDEARARAVGADGHITKPFEAQALVDTVNARLRAPRPAPAPPPEALTAAAAAPADAEPFDFLEEEPTAPRHLAAADPGRTTLLMGEDAAPLDAGDDAFSFDAEDGEDGGFALEEEPFAATALALEEAAPAAASASPRAAREESGDDVTRIVVADERAPAAAASFADDALDDMFGDEEEPVALAPAPALASTFEPPAAEFEAESLEEAFSEPPLASDGPEPIAAFAQDDDPYGDTLAGAPPLATEAPPAASAAPAASPDLSPLLRQQLHETLEKIAWEALGDVAERLVRDAVARVEEVAWEVIPRMAETLIQEEIRKLKRGE